MSKLSRQARRAKQIESRRSEKERRMHSPGGKSKYAKREHGNGGQNGFQGPTQKSEPSSTGRVFGGSSSYAYLPPSVSEQWYRRF